MKEGIMISEIQIIPVRPQNGLIAFASFVLNQSFFVGNIAVYTKPDGLGCRLVYPEKILPNGKKLAIAYPITKMVGQAIASLVSEKYENLMMKSNENVAKHDTTYKRNRKN
ncbi:MAG: septation protein SpoVG family protein [bacterium]|nr:SpoVG family protein [Candidatus Margulisiibacteriota bacterium]